MEVALSVDQSGNPARESRLWAERLTLLLESTGEGIYGINLQGRCTFINRAGAGLLGYPVEEVLGKNMHYLIHHTHCNGAHYPVEQCPIFHAFQKGQGCRIESDVLWRRDGSCFPAAYTSYPIFDGDHIIGAVVTFTDITERKQAEAILSRYREQLEQLVADRTQELSAANHQLHGLIEQVRQLSAHAEGVREEERTRIAREIHDELGSTLVALKMDLCWLKSRLPDEDTIRRKMSTMLALTDNAVENLGRIITDLRPSILDHQGLWAALEWYAQEFSQATQLRCRFQIQVSPGAGHPAEDIATAVYRMFQEILNNIARHAQAQHIAVVIAVNEGDCHIHVTDDGIGIRPEQMQAPTSYGVMGLHERARYFGGKVMIEGIPGEGTRVDVYMPIYSEATGGRT